MIELVIGFILGVILITFLKSSSMVDYEEKITELENTVFQLKRSNNILRADNERLKNAFVWKVDK